MKKLIHKMLIISTFSSFLKNISYQEFIPPSESKFYKNYPGWYNNVKLESLFIR